MSYLSINEAALNSVVEEVVEQAVENAVSEMSIESSVECQIGATSIYYHNKVILFRYL